jgi:predicted nucleic acid-binding protein
LEALNEFTPVALESGCTVLYSEDMQDGQLIDDTLTIKNSFCA